MFGVREANIEHQASNLKHRNKDYMKKLIPILFLSVAVSSFVSINTKTAAVINKPLKDTLMADRQKYLTAIKTDLGTKINSPADSVFKNIKTLKGKSAEQLLSIMDGWGHALGVTCKFCHDVNDWASEKPRHFNQTREMVEMTNRMNKEILASLKTFRQPVVMGCIGCHNEMKEPREK
jgi:hypothetical protein